MSFKVGDRVLFIGIPTDLGREEPEIQYNEIYIIRNLHKISGISRIWLEGLRYIYHGDEFNVCGQMRFNFEGY